MFQFKHTFVIKNPAGTYSYVGRIPVVLGNQVPATVADIMGGRAHRYNEDTPGDCYTWKFPNFPTRTEAVEFAAQRGVEVKS